MSLFPGFSSMFSVGRTISQSADTDPSDVLKTKNALAQTGDYKVPDFGITDIPDMGMIDGLKSFQKKNGLKVDGVMKPVGPTENKIGETLANQGISTIDPLASNISKPKTKPTKIDPLTGLPEVKMPKLKKPTNTIWEQAENQQKQETNPWFKSAKLQPVSGEIHAGNTRTMDGMLNYSENGFLPTLFADAVKNGGDKAIAEYANFLNQLSNRKKERGDGFEQEVMNKLSDNQKQIIHALAEGAQETDGDIVVYQVSDDQAEPQATEQEKSEQGQTQKNISPECEALKPKYQDAKRKYNRLNSDYGSLSGEYFKLGPRRDTLRSDIQSGVGELGLGSAAGMLLMWLSRGALSKAISYVLKKVGRKKARQLLSDMREFDRISGRIKEIQPKLKPLKQKLDNATADFKRMEKKARAMSCQLYGW